MEVKVFVKDFVTRLKKLLDDVDAEVIANIISVLEKTLENKSGIYILGNGGSSATASYMVNDLGAGLRRRKIKILML